MAKRDLVSVGMAFVVTTFLGVILANEIVFHWFQRSAVWYFSVFLGLVGLLFLSATIAYSGDVYSRIYHGFNVVGHKIPWSLLSLAFSLSVFLFMGQSSTSQSLSGPGSGLSSTLLAAIIGLSVLVTIIIMEE